MKKQECAGVKRTSKEDSPFEIEFFMLQGVGFRCMGYRDQKGRWRSAFNHVELFGTIKILEERGIFQAPPPEARVHL